MTKHWFYHQLWILVLLLTPCHYTCWNKLFFYSSFYSLYWCQFFLLECFVLLYFVDICGSMSRYYVLPWTVNCFHILCFIALLHLSATQDFYSFSVECIFMLFVQQFFEMFVIKLFSFINPKTLWLSALFDYCIKCFSHTFTFIVLQKFHLNVFAENINNHEQIYVSFIPFTELRHVNQIWCPNFINTVDNNAPQGEFCFYWFPQFIS